MTEYSPPETSLTKLIIASLFAFILATVILIGAVLPSEFGIDPTGVGKKMGLTALAPQSTESGQAPSDKEVVDPCEDLVKELDQLKMAQKEALEREKNKPIFIGSSGKKTTPNPTPSIEEAALPPELQNSPPQPIKTIQPTPANIPSTPLPKVTVAPTPIKTSAPTPLPPQWKDTISITIPPRNGLEYKFHVEKGEILTYSWKTNGSPVFFEFHGEPRGDTTGYFKSFKKTTDSQSSGSLTAPFAGSHGWYWQNDTTNPITLQLKTRGKYRVLGYQ